MGRMVGFSPRTSFDRPAPGPLDPGVALATPGSPTKHFGGQRLFALRAVDRSHLVGWNSLHRERRRSLTSLVAVASTARVGSRTGGEARPLRMPFGLRRLPSLAKPRPPLPRAFQRLGDDRGVFRRVAIGSGLPQAAGTASVLVGGGRLREPRTVLTQESSRERSSVTFRGDFLGQRRAADSPCGSS